MITENRNDSRRFFDERSEFVRVRPKFKFFYSINSITYQFFYISPK